MRTNRTMPADVLIPVLTYPSVPEAVVWLTKGFGFTLRWRIEDHRAQLGVGATAAIAIAEGEARETTDHVMVRVEDVPGHRRRALQAGASVTEVEDHFFGERQYSAADHTGRLWVFTESIADIDPQDWGAVTTTEGLIDTRLSGPSQ